MNPVIIVAIIAGSAFFGLREVWPISRGVDKAASSKPASESSVVKEPAKSTAKKEEPTKTETTKSITAEDCFDDIERAVYQSKYLNHTNIIEKVCGKVDSQVKRTVILKDSTGNVIGKSEDIITLEAGKNNFFAFNFDTEITDDMTMDESTKMQSEWMRGKNDGVELVTFNRNEKNIYLTFRQTVDDLDGLPSFKLLYYKDGQIVGHESGHFSIYSDELCGKDTESVTEIYVGDLDFDDLEYIYEP